jgi:hypothetical protein
MLGALSVSMRRSMVHVRSFAAGSIGIVTVQQRWHDLGRLPGGNAGADESLARSLRTSNRAVT